jgi:hypothetical protein
MEEISADIHRHLAKLEDPSKIERKKNIEKLKILVEQKFDQQIDDSIVLTLWQDRLCRPLLRCLGSDPSERVREISGEIVLHFIQRFPSYESDSGSSGSGDFMKMSYLFPLLQSRLVNILRKTFKIKIFQKMNRLFLKF